MNFCLEKLSQIQHLEEKLDNLGVVQFGQTSPKGFYSRIFFSIWLIKMYIIFHSQEPILTIIGLRARGFWNRLVITWQYILPSSATCWSVNKNTTFLFSIPSLLYKFFRSSLNELSLYPLLNWISNTSHPAVKEASLHKLCLPLPPTPTNRAWPWSIRITRWIRVKCSKASSNSTRFIGVLLSLYSSNICK